MRTRTKFLSVMGSVGLVAAGVALHTPLMEAPGDQARIDWIRTIQRDAGPRFAFAPGDAADLAQVVIGDATFEVDGDGVSVSRAGEPWRVGLELQRIGREHAAQWVPRGAPRFDNNVSLAARGPLEERWVSGPLGLEQIIDIAERPSGVGDLLLDVAVSGDLVATSRGGVIELRDATDAVRARYSDLFVQDAQGRRVPAVLELASADIRLRIDDASATYPLVIDPLVGVEQAHLFANNAATLDNFGGAIAFDGTTAVVGAALGDGNVADSGAVYVFTRAGGIWSAPTRLVASDGAASDRFGASVALSGDTLVVGSPRVDAGATADVGATYVFTRTGVVWSQTQRLGASDASANDRFGSSVAIEGNTIVVGAPRDDTATAADCGSAYIFTFAAGTWTQSAHPFASDGAAGDQFGFTVAISAGTIVAGASSDDVPGAVDGGSVYVLTGAGASWTEAQHLVATDAQMTELFGATVALQGATLAVGAINRTAGGGSVVTFDRNGTGVWVQGQRLAPSPVGAGEFFGSGLSLDGNQLLAGTGGSAGPGYALVFARSAGVWSQSGRVAAADGATGDAFGTGAAIVADTVVVGASFDDTTAGGTDSGSAYVELLRAANGDVCSSGASCASGICVDGVCCNTTCGGGVSDCQACAVAAGAATNGICGTFAGGTTCRPAIAGGCDAAEFCNGVATTCPIDSVALAGTPCRGSAGACDVADTCDGILATCTDNRVAAGTVCRPSSGSAICDPAESCVATNPACPADANTDGTSCSNGVACDGAEVCAAGACPAGTPLTCGDTDACTADSCAEPGGCMHTHISGCCNVAADCDDSNGCTADVCSGAGGTCTHMPLMVCVDAGPPNDAGTDAALLGDASVRDAGADTGVHDAGHDSAVDGGAGVDIGPMTPASSNCGCAAAGVRESTNGLPLFLLGLALLAARRRGR
jgi:MYXO-CTERM domain-containing protein